MPTAVERLSIIIDLVDSFSDELTRLLIQLGEVETALQAVDDHTIDIDVRDRELTTLLGKLGAARVASIGGGGAVGGGGRGSTGSASRNLRRFSSSASEATDEMQTTSLRMSTLHNALAQLVPLLVVIILALPALIGGLVALAGAALAAAGALVGLTAFAGLGAALARGEGDLMEGMRDILEQVQQDFMDAFRPLAEQLAPLFEEALRGLDRLFQAIAAEGDAFLQLTDMARAFGAFIIETLPSFLADLATFAEASAEALGEVGEALGNIDLFAMFSEILAKTLPLLIKFGEEFAQLLALLFELSLGFLIVTNAIIEAINIILDIITVFGFFGKEMGLLVGIVLALWTAYMAVNSALATFVTMIATKALFAVGSLIMMLAKQGVMTTIVTGATWALNAAIKALTFAVITLLAVSGIGILISIFGGIASAAFGASDGIQSATDALRAFEAQRSRMTGGDNPFANPDLGPGDPTGRSRFAGGGSVTVNIEGDADRDTVRKQLQNANYRLERPGRAI